jgi:NCS1 family nucleobase:cation symporter-1
VPATVATLAGCAAAWIGAFVPALAPVYDYAWFVGFLVAGGAYLALVRALGNSVAAAPAT